MDILHVIVLSIIQGLTEFLPISSSAHLILPKELLGWPDQGLAFDVAVHMGTLAAVVTYFRKDLSNLFMGWLRSVSGGDGGENGRLAWLIVAATIPAAVFGLLMDDLIETHLRSLSVIATATIVFGIFLALADRQADTAKRRLTQLTLVTALIIGVAQAMALVPGTSRSGITITAALFLGFSRVESARFSFLLSVPVILMSGGYKGLSLIGQSSVDWFSIGLGALLAAISAYVCIFYFLSFINRIGMMPFVIYRMILGAVLIAFVVI